MRDIPGWMRFGFSRSLVDRTPYRLRPTTLPISQMRTVCQNEGFSLPGFATPCDPWGIGEVSTEEAIGFLQNQAEVLENELDEITKKIENLEKGG